MLEPTPVQVITFRPLVAADMPMLHEWLCRPHVVEWWEPAPSLDDVVEDFLPLTLPDAGTRGYIALHAGAPIGFIQSYVVAGSGDGWWETETDPGARGIDQFLADPSRLNQGLGSAMVRAFVDRLFLDPAVTKVQTDPDPENARAIRAYQKAGFVAQRVIDTPDGPALLMVRTRDAR